MEGAISKCPVVKVNVSGHSINWTLERKCQRSKRSSSGTTCRHWDITGWIPIAAANGLPVPYIGYVDGELVVMRKVFKDMGFLATRDSVGADRQQKVDRPGIIGCNILSRVGNILAAELG